MDIYYEKSDVFFCIIYFGVENVSSNKKLNPTSFSAAFSAFQLWSFDVLFDFPVIVYFSPFIHYIYPHNNKNFYALSFCFCFFFAVSDVGFSAINLTYSLFVWLVSHFPVSLSFSLTHCFTVLFVSILNIKQLTHTQKRQQQKLIVITVDYQQFPLCTN